MGSSQDDLQALPKKVRATMGFALHLAQSGEKHPKAKPLKGFHGAGVLEIVEDFEGDTYRCVDTVRFGDAVYVLHVFQKKARRGIETPRREMELVRVRLRQAEERHLAEENRG
jgi:phage-related protein